MREDVKYVNAQLPAFEKLSFNEVSIRLEAARHHLLCADAALMLFGIGSIGNPATLTECLSCCMAMRQKISKYFTGLGMASLNEKQIADLNKMLDRLGKASEALMINPELWLCVTLV